MKKCLVWDRDSVPDAAGLQASHPRPEPSDSPEREELPSSELSDSAEQEELSDSDADVVEIRQQQHSDHPLSPDTYVLHIECCAWLYCEVPARHAGTFRHPVPHTLLHTMPKDTSTEATAAGIDEAE